MKTPLLIAEGISTLSSNSGLKWIRILLNSIRGFLDRFLHRLQKLLCTHNYIPSLSSLRSTGKVAQFQFYRVRAFLEVILSVIRLKYEFKSFKNFVYHPLPLQAQHNSIFSHNNFMLRP